MSRLIPALLAGLAALAVAAVVAATGSAQSSTPTTLDLVSKTQRHVGFNPKARPRAGSTFGFGDRITGDDTGYDRGVCTLIAGRQMLCDVVVHLARGNLIAQGLLPQRANHTPFAITGGTGAYDGARGTALVTDVSSSTTDIAVTLKP